MTTVANVLLVIAFSLLSACAHHHPYSSGYEDRGSYYFPQHRSYYYSKPDYRHYEHEEHKHNHRGGHHDRGRHDGEDHGGEHNRGWHH